MNHKFTQSVVSCVDNINCYVASYRTLSLCAHDYCTTLGVFCNWNEYYNNFFLFICLLLFSLFLSRSSEMLVAFHSSPFSAPLQTNVPNRGFELNVDILYTDSDSYDYAQGTNKNICEFHINASNPGLCATTVLHT